MSAKQWPSRWAWDLELSPHLAKRMDDRGFNEVELRRMLEHAEGHEPDIVEGRFVIAARHGGRPWDVIVEPEADRRLLVVITAYPVERDTP